MDGSTSLRTPEVTIIVILLFVIGLILFVVYGNIASSIITAVLTIIIGVISFVLGQIAIKFFIEPIQRQQEHIGKIAHYLIFYADLWANPGFGPDDKIKEAEKKFRQLASELRALTNLVKGYYYFSSLGIVPSYIEIETSARNLIGLSNSLRSMEFPDERETRRHTHDLIKRNQQSMNEIESALDIKMGLGVRE
jgi:hypothetical protein